MNDAMRDLLMAVYDEAGDMPATWVKATELPHAALELQEHGLMRVREDGGGTWSLSLTEMGAAIAGKLWAERQVSVDGQSK